MQLLATAGHSVIQKSRDRLHILAVLVAVVYLAILPRSWPRTVRNVLARQILFTGVEAIGLMSGIAVLVGISVVLQAQLWLNKVGERALLGPLLVVVVVRELAPILVNLLLIIRSASAVASEMANMKLSGEVRVLDAQGLDPLAYLVMPRVVGMALCAFCLAMIFVLVALISGYIFGVFTGSSIHPTAFADSVLGSLAAPDVLNLVIKSMLPAALTAVICCTEGLSVGSDVTEIPRATSRGLARSVIAMFATAAAVSLLTYL